MHEEELPAASVTVSVTVFGPAFVQSKKEGVTVLETIPQLSVLPLSTCVAVIVVVFPTSCTVIFLHIATGGVLSFTVTVAVHEEELPAASLTVSVTVFTPRLPQLNVAGVTVLETIAQLSVLPLSTDAPVIVTELPTNATVIFLQMATGGVLSTTVTVAVHEEELPASSVTVNVTVFAPSLLQSNDDGVTVLETIVQLSVLPLSICAAVIVALFPTNATVIFLHIAAGGVLSTTVTEAVHEEELPAASVTVNVTVFAPRLVQLKEDGVTVLETIAQLSVLPLST